MSETNQLDRKDLKIQALLEKISNMTAQYENQLADARVEYTILSQHNEELQSSITELKVSDEAKTEEPDGTSDKN